MTREDLFTHVAQHAIVGVVRESDEQAAAEVARAYVENGLMTIEITFTTPNAMNLLATMVQRYADRGIVFAAGTVRSDRDAAEARRAGAKVIVSPHTDFRVIDYCIEHELLCVAGASTPTEIIRAWEAGAGIIKVYPAAYLGGPDFISTIRQPIRDIPMLAGGPVNLDEIDSYLDAGAIAVNLGGSLAVPNLVARRDWDEIGKRVLLASSIVRSRRSTAASQTSMVH